MNNSRKLVLNTALLTAAAFIMRTVDVSYNVFLTNRIGAAGIGLFQLTLTVYAMAVTFSCAGVRFGATRLNIDLLSKDPQASLRRSMALCVGWALGVSIIVAVVLYSAAPVIADRWLHDLRTEPSLRMLALGLPMVSVTAAMTGYFTAVRTVYKSALSQGFEQAVKIVCVIIFLNRMLPRGLEFASLAIVYGMVIGQVAVMVLAALLLQRSRYIRRRARPQDRVPLRSLLRISGPEAAGACDRSVLLTTEHLLIPRGFQASGRTNEEAMRIYGIVQGMTLPVLLYPSAVLSSLASLLVPELSQLRVQGKTEQINLAVGKIIKLAMLYGIFAGGMFYAFAEPLSMAIYGNTDAAKFLQLLAPLVPIMYMDMSVDGMLKGLDQQKASMMYNIFDSAICVVLVYLLLPRLAIKGYIIVLFVSELYNFFFSIRRLLKVTDAPRPTLRGVVEPILCAAASAMIPTAVSKALFPAALASVPGLVIAIMASGAIYLGALRMLGCVQRDEVKLLTRRVFN